MTTYEHGGIKIEFNERLGTFAATIKGKHQTAASLSGIKKKIDDAARDSFQPFPALVWRSGYGNSGKDFASTQVVGIIKGRSKYGYSAKDKWETTGEGEHHEVMVDTPANRAAIKAYRDWQKETKKLSHKRDEGEKELRDKIAVRTPDGK